MGVKEQVVHINCVRPLLQKDTSLKGALTWAPPLFQHAESDEADDQETENHTPDAVVVWFGHQTLNQ